MSRCDCGCEHELADAREVLARVDVAVRDAREAGGAETVVRIGSSPYLPVQDAHRFLDAFHARDGASQARITELLLFAQVRRLRSGELDFGIFPATGELDGFELESLFAAEPMAAFLPSDHHLAERESLGPDDLRDEVLIAIPQDGEPESQREYVGLLDRAGYRFANVREAGGTSPREVLLTVASGFGITIQRASFDEVSGARGLVIRRLLDPPVSVPETVVAWRSQAAARLRPAIAAARGAARELRQLQSTA